MRALVLLLALGGATVSTLASAGTEKLETSIESRLESLRVDYGFPGATAAWVLPDGSSGTTAVGLADRELTTPMTPDSRMLAASLGKSFVGALVLSLESEGRLDTGDRVMSILGDRDWYARLPNADTMTVADLLRHTSGLPDHVYTEAFAAETARRVANGGEGLPPEATIAFVLDEPPLFPSGEDWSYSDTGYLLLGLIIERVTGRDYYDLLDARFLDPLGLTATTPSDRQSLPNLAVGYTVEDNPFGLPPRTVSDEGRLLWDPATEWTGGGLVTTSRDLAIWGQALFTGEAMASPYLDHLVDGAPVSPDVTDLRYGAGVSVRRDTPHGSVYGHGGWVPGYVSSLRHYADHDVTIAFQINTDVGIVDDSTNLVEHMERQLADAVLEVISKRNQ